MDFNEYINVERFKDYYDIPTLEELEKYKNGEPDNVLTGKTYSEIFQYLYKECDYQMIFSKTSFDKYGYTFADISNQFENGNEVYQIVFPDGSTLDVWNLEK